jgi:hypothetical protein
MLGQAADRSGLSLKPPCRGWCLAVAPGNDRLDVLAGNPLGHECGGAGDRVEDLLDEVVHVIGPKPKAFMSAFLG